VEDKLAPWLVVMVDAEVCGKGGILRAEPAEGLAEVGGEFLKIAGEGKLGGELLQLPVEHYQRAEAEFAERGLGDGGGHQRMAVTIAADPSPEADSRPLERI
jgi:hypothetical protein